MIADADPKALELRAAVWADPRADGPRMAYQVALRETAVRSLRPW